VSGTFELETARDGRMLSTASGERYTSNCGRGCNFPNDGSVKWSEAGFHIRGAFGGEKEE